MHIKVPHMHCVAYRHSYAYHVPHMSLVSPMHCFSYNRTVEMGNTTMSKEEVTHSSACMRRKCLHVSTGFGANPRPSKAASQI